MIAICKICGKEYNIKPYRKNTSKYCSRSCSSKANYQTSLANVNQDYKYGNQFRKGHKPTNAFGKGHIPWNKGLKRIHLSPRTELKKGRKSEKFLIGTIRERIDNNGKKRNYIKIGSPNKWEVYYKYLWEQKFGIIPKGYVIHHINKISNDDRLENLELLTRKEHINIHREDILVLKLTQNGIKLP